MTTMMDRLPGALSSRAGSGSTATSATRRGTAARWICALLLGVLVLPLVMSVFASPALADDDDAENYSLYQLASNASTYFGEKASPSGGGIDDNWDPIVESPATGGSMLGYADPDFSLNDVVGWMFAEATGSKQTISHDTLDQGMLEYAQFGAANRDLGLDTMSSGIPGQIVSVIGGAFIWVSYLLAIVVNTVFGLAINFLQLINPFQWFYQAVEGAADAQCRANAPEGTTVTGCDSAHQQMLADGMTAGSGSSGFLPSLQAWIADWYGLLQSIAWGVMVPLFLGFLLISLVLFKKMDKGSAVKKFFVRLVFIGLGLPLIGSMYSAVLDNFDDAFLSQHAGPTRVVLSNYTDFESWMQNERLRIPNGATIEWKDGAASPTAQASVRTTARAINAASNPAFAGLSPGTAGDTVVDAWEDGTGNFDPNAGPSDAESVFHTFGLIGRFMTGDIVSASDFAGDIQTSVSNLSVNDEDKQKWFVDVKTYGDVDKFGEDEAINQGAPAPEDHPVISTRDQAGLTASGLESGGVRFTSVGVVDDCGYATGFDGGSDPSACNLAPLAAYNYLNTGFNESSIDMYSSNKLGSDLVRSDHLAVSQVGTGPAKFMNWMNTGTLLSCISMLGLWYAVGLVFGAVKRTIGLVTAIPFATLGAMAAIAKVITYTAALILEVIVTLFAYQFVSELLVSLPDIISGPLSDLMANNDLFSTTSLAGVMIVAMTLVSTILIIGATFAMLRVRKTMLQALDEVVTKLVDKFLDTNTPPKPDKGGMLPAMAGGIGAGAGMAAGNKLAGMAGDKVGGMFGGGKGKSPSNAQQKAQTTNAGGLNAQKALSGGTRVAGALGPGSDGPGGPDGPTPNGGPDSPAPDGGGSGGGAPGSTGGVLGGNRSAKETAQSVSANGGLSDLGYSSGGGQPIVMEKGDDGVYRSSDDPTSTGLSPQSPSGQSSTGAPAGPGQRGGTGPSPVPGGTAFGQQPSEPGSQGADGVASTRFDGGQQGQQDAQRPGQRPAPGSRPGVKTQFGTAGQTGQQSSAQTSQHAPASAQAGPGQNRTPGQQSSHVVPTKFGQTAPQGAPSSPASPVEAEPVQPQAPMGTGQPVQAPIVGQQPSSAAPPTAQPGPVPLHQVPMTSASNHVQRRPGQTDRQFMKSKATAEGWRQTPQGWVPPVGSASGTAARPGTAPTAQRQTPATGPQSPAPKQVRRAGSGSKAQPQRSFDQPAQQRPASTGAQTSLRRGPAPAASTPRTSTSSAAPAQPTARSQAASPRVGSSASTPAQRPASQQGPAPTAPAPAAPVAPAQGTPRTSEPAPQKPTAPKQGPTQRAAETSRRPQAGKADLSNPEVWGTASAEQLPDAPDKKPSRGRRGRRSARSRRRRG